MKAFTKWAFTSIFFISAICGRFFKNNRQFFNPFAADALESETEKKRYEALQAIENIIMKRYNISNDDYKIIETVILKTEPHKAGDQWKFTGAFYYGAYKKVFAVTISFIVLNGNIDFWQ